MSPFFNVTTMALVVLAAARMFSVVDTTLPSEGAAVGAGVAVADGEGVAVVGEGEGEAVAVAEGVAVGPTVVLVMYCDDT